MQLRRAQSLRRLGAARFDAAEAALGTALRAYPNYSAALLERALLMMDAWRPERPPPSRDYSRMPEIGRG